MAKMMGVLVAVVASVGVIAFSAHAQRWDEARRHGARSAFECPTGAAEKVCASMALERRTR